MKKLKCLYNLTDNQIHKEIEKRKKIKQKLNKFANENPWIKENTGISKIIKLINTSIEHFENYLVKRKNSPKLIKK